MVAASISVVGFVNVTRDDSFQVPDGLPLHHIEGSTDLPGNFYISFVYTQNIMMLDGKGDIVWAKHTDHKDDGVKTGYANEELARMADQLSIPIIASGGAGEMEHFRDAFSIGHADAALAASVFHFGEISIPDLKHYLKNEGINVRL
jgi:imidazole glycerol phosphate synthase subunit HisF